MMKAYYLLSNLHSPACDTSPLILLCAPRQDNNVNGAVSKEDVEVEKSKTTTNTILLPNLMWSSEVPSHKHKHT